MKLFFIISVSVFISLNGSISAQDTIWFLSGERLITSNYTLKTEDGMLTYFNKRNKEKQVGLEYVFSIHGKNGYEKIIYEPSIMNNIPFSVEQMRNFIKGEFEASEHCHAVGATLTGLIAGCGSVYFFLTFGPTEFYSPIVPAGTSAIVGMTNVSKRHIMRKYPEYADDEYFKAGYAEIGKQKRVSHSIMGGIIGLTVGVASTFIIKKVN